jgi:prevent-host-death family protein
MAWQLQDAINRFGALLKAAEPQGPQAILVRGKGRAILLSADDYHRLVARKGSPIDFFQRSPWSITDIPVRRSRDVGREIEP